MKNPRHKPFPSLTLCAVSRRSQCPVPSSLARAMYTFQPSRPTLTMRCLWLAHRTLRNARRPYTDSPSITCLGGAANGSQVVAIP
ncbi:hypothetical protein BGW80DRAFT_1353391 [Lactifluus volemus]|nr:hypothetical protein BGW80DRAFT_1353391 [Lactifluus volemus]